MALKKTILLTNEIGKALIPSMDFRRRGKIAAIKARLEICEAERHELLHVLTTRGANLAKISEHADRIQKEMRRLTNELKVLELPEPEE